MQTGITTAVLNGANAPATQNGETVATQPEELVMGDYVFGGDTEQAVPFVRYGQDGAREVTRGLPANLSTNALR